VSRWRKACASSASCVEIMVTEEEFLMRDSKEDGNGPVLVFDRADWDELRAYVKTEDAP
jgi:hypothetical protein